MNFWLKHIAALAWLAILLLVGACGNLVDDDPRLARADAVMESNPLLALDILDSIDRKDFRPSDSAYYALLYTQAQIKDFIEVDKDTLLSAAYRYYTSLGNKDNRTMRVYHYQGRVSYNGADYHTAMQNALESYERAKEADHPYWIAKSAELISDIFDKMYNYPQAEEYTKIAIDNYGKAGRTSNQRYSIADLAYIYLNQKKDEKAKQLLDSTIILCQNEQSVDSALLQYLNSPLTTYYIASNQYDKLDSTFLKNKINSDQNIVSLMGAINKSRILQGLHKFDESKNVLQNYKLKTLSDEEKGQLLYAQFLDAKLGKRYEEATGYMDSIIILVGKVTNNLLYDYITNVKSEFYTKRAIQLKTDNYNLYIKYVVSIAISLLIIIILIIISRYRTAKKNFEIDSLINDLKIEKDKAQKNYEQRKILLEILKQEHIKIESLKIRLNNTEIEKDEVIQSLFKNQWQTLNMLCDEYFEKNDSENTRKILFKNITKELHNLKSKDNLERIEEQINLCMHDIIKNLRTQCRFLAEDEIIFIMLYLAGFSIRAICFFTGIKYKTFHNKKIRLRNKISNSDIENKEIFLSLLE